jgi:hypothetical protein
LVPKGLLKAAVAARTENNPFYGLGSDAETRASIEDRAAAALVALACTA